MDDQQKTVEPEDVQGPDHSQPRRRRRLWVYVVLLLAWTACSLSLIIFLVAPLIYNRLNMSIPVTGADPANPPQSSTPTLSQSGTPVSGAEYLNQATQRLDTCTSSFNDYFVLEHLAVNQPDVFGDSAWQSDVTQAMQSFRADCDALGSLPTAPAAYADVDHWLKLAAGEVDPSADSLQKAIDQNKISQFQASVDHLLKFVDYIHQAEGAMNGIQQRKQVRFPQAGVPTRLSNLIGSRQTAIVVFW